MTSLILMWGYKKTAYRRSVNGLCKVFHFSDLSFRNGLSKPFPNGKYAGIGEAARGAAPYSERSDAKQPGHLAVRAVCLAERTYSHQESIEVRPLFQRDYLMEICSPSIIMRSLSTFSAASIASLMAFPTRVTPH